MRPALVLWIVISGCHAAPPVVPAGAATPATAPAFHVPPDVGALVVDADAFARFAGEVRGQLARRGDTDALFVLAMLDALDEHWSAAVVTLDRIAATEPDPNMRAMRGLTLRVWADTVGN